MARGAEKSDPVGTWKIAYRIGEQERTATLVIKKEGEILAGTMSWVDQKEANLGEQKLTVEYRFTIKGDELLHSW